MNKSRRCVSSFRRRVVCHPKALLCFFGSLCRRRYDRRHDAKPRMPASCRVSSSSYLDSCEGIGKVGVPTLGVGHPVSSHVCPEAPLRFILILSRHTIGIARFGVGQQASCRMVFRNQSSVCLDCCVDIMTKGVGLSCRLLCVLCTMYTKSSRGDNVCVSLCFLSAVFNSRTSTQIWMVFGKNVMAWGSIHKQHRLLLQSAIPAFWSKIHEVGSALAPLAVVSYNDVRLQIFGNTKLLCAVK